MPMNKPIKHWEFALLMAALAALGPFSVDTYFPSFPAIAAYYRVSLLEVQSTLTLYLVALAVMSLFHGALSDSFGRRRIILVCLGVYVVTALLCPLAPKFGYLLFWRVAQGLAAGAGMIVGRAIIRDCFEGAAAQRFMAQVTMVSALAPAVAPVLGGWLHVWFGWRGPFVFLGALGTAVLLACWRWMPESLPVTARQSFHPGKLLRSYGQVATHPGFVTLSLAMGLGGSGFLLYVASAPDVVLNILHLTPTQFGWLFVPNVAGLILGSAVASRLAGRIAPLQMVHYGYFCMAAAAAVNVLYHFFLPARIPWSVAPLALYTFGFALFAPVATVMCLDIFPERRGLASSLQGCIQLVMFALVSSLIARLVFGSALKHAVAMAIAVGLNWLCWWAFRHLHGTQAGLPPMTRKEAEENPFAPTA
jgi:DHA1 family bicyclomycin/chloramphenicol resistance-like MFS transporter